MISKRFIKVKIEQGEIENVKRKFRSKKSVLFRTNE